MFYEAKGNPDKCEANIIIPFFSIRFIMEYEGIVEVTYGMEQSIMIEGKDKERFMDEYKSFSKTFKDALERIATGGLQ